MNVVPTDYFSIFSLLVAGNATWVSGSVFPLIINSTDGGFIGVGGVFNAPQYLQLNRINSYITDTQFDAAQAYYISIQTELSSLGYNAFSQIIYTDGLLITCNSSTDVLYHVQVDGATLSTVNWYILQNCLFTAGWVIEVTGTADVTFQGSPFPGVVERVVYNIVGTGRTISGTNGVGGNILAPQNTYVQYNGVTYGRLIVGNIIYARQNNKPNCINFEDFVITNLNLKAVTVGSDYIYVVDLSNYVVGDLVCFNGDCHTVTGGIIGDLDGNGVLDNVLTVSPPFTQNYAANSFISTNVNPNTQRTALIPVVMTTPTASTKPINSGASQFSIPILSLLALLFFLF